MILHDWFEWSNAGIGLSALVLTLGAIWQATGAMSAAIEARKAIGYRNATESFAEVVRLAEQFAT